MITHDYSPWPVPIVPPTTPAPACGCDDPVWFYPDNASWGCGNCCRATHPNVKHHSCRGREGLHYAAFVREHDRLSTAIEVQGLDPLVVPVPEDTERVVSLRAMLVDFIRDEFHRVGDHYVLGAIVGALESFGYPDELSRAIAIVEGRKVDTKPDPRRELAELRRECMLCASHYDEDQRVSKTC